MLRPVQRGNYATPHGTVIEWFSAGTVPQYININCQPNRLTTPLQLFPVTSLRCPLSQIKSSPHGWPTRQAYVSFLFSILFETNLMNIFAFR